MATSASRASCGNRPSSSTAAANGTIFASASARTDSRSMSCSSEGRYRSKSLPMTSVHLVVGNTAPKVTLELPAEGALF
ncbi:hypothetical protein ACWCQ0_52305, partial [Streptomyces massasporeus]